MSWFRLASLALVLIIAACGDEEENVRGVGTAVVQPQPDAGTKVVEVVDTARPAVDAAPIADAGASVDAAPPPALTHPPGWIKALRFLGQGRHLLAQEQPAEAVKALQAARDAFPDEGWLHLELAKACLTAENSECAISASNAALEKADGQAALEAMAHLLQGRAQKATGNIEEAEAAYQRSIAVSPSEAVVQLIAELRAPDAAEIEPPEDVTCTRTAPEGDPFVASVSDRSEARDAAICPVLEAPFAYVEPNGDAAQVSVLALLKRPRNVHELLADQGGLSAQGSFPLLLVRNVRDVPEVVVLDEGRDRDRQDEIISEISTDIRRILLGPSRHGLVVEVTTRGWWNIGSRTTPYSFERTELFLVSRQLNRLTLVARQLTYESGHERSDDCLFGSVSRLVTRDGTMWLEDLDQSGVPEICQETREQGAPRPEWLGGQHHVRLAAMCQQWVASAIQGSPRPVPSLRLDEAEIQRSRHEVLDVSRVPTILRINVRPLIRENEVVLASKNLELTLSGAHAIAVLVTDTNVRVATANAGDTTTSLDLGTIGRWQEIWATINANNPTLIQVEVTARGHLDDAVERRWVHLITAGPGEAPDHALQVEVYSEQPLTTDPCPSITTARQQRETRDDALYLRMNKLRRTGPGIRAFDRARTGLCQFVRSWTTEADAGPALDVGIPELAPVMCPVGSAELPSERFAQGPDGRFARTTLP